ncbi:BUD22 domain protein [Metarhizium robertsii]|uniref:Bud-site selection protein, BUD22 n=2 Tax=Metarhizium robertsii TaxID=568076 RepID=E9EPN9_METRA|nr:Bud-site selection protein, BUD22 [Metarhizium robertsii ARSEF 23]EFZ02720.1 Bud-site selection protein, BUD22 [Metarhizium robertsii ARSEF 23]EXV05942.1 BUD22 domain protein [Metarhizium robertsii]
MPKRKRSGQSSVHAELEKYQDEVFRALKASKGFERQRLSKRLRDPGITQDKVHRLEREIAVLKSLDLHQTARAHLHLSLLKVKSIASSTDLPQELLRGVSKPDLPEDEKAALHNVTSGLYNREPVKQAVGRAVEAVCGVLNVSVPENDRRTRKNKKEDREEQPSARAEKLPGETKSATPSENPADEWDEESEFEGFSTDVDDPGSVLEEQELDSDAEAKEVTEFDKLDGLLGSSSDEEDDWNSDKYAQFRGRETVNLDDISVSGSGEESEAESVSQASSQSLSPPPEKKQKKDKKASAKTGPVRDSTFLPSLMGGYISGSESASDIEEAKPKNRRGQRARQAIWEQKYGSGAKHLQKPQKKSGRDSGWDMRRGAVDGEDRGRRTPWKKGIQNPVARNGIRGDDAPAPVAKRDDEGKLHPSWEARKKAKESQKAVAFAGSKVVFD